MLEESFRLTEAWKAVPDIVESPSQNSDKSKSGGSQIERTVMRDGKETTIYQCDQCEKKYFRWSHLVRHSRNHSSEKRYRCKVCSKRFFRVDVMKRHVLKHERRQQPRQPAASTSSSSQSNKKSTRVSRACKACAIAKVRCSEEKPCKNCVDKGLNCSIEAQPASVFGARLGDPDETREPTEEEIELEIQNKITRSLSDQNLERGKTLRAPLCTPWGFAPLVWPLDDEDILASSSMSNGAFNDGDGMQIDGMINHDPEREREWTSPGWGVVTREIGKISGILRLSHNRFQEYPPNTMQEHHAEIRQQRRTWEETGIMP